MKDRCEREQAFLDLFNLIHGEPPVERFLPMEFEGIVYTPKVKRTTNVSYIKIDYTNDKTTVRYSVYLEKETYVKDK